MSFNGVSGDNLISKDSLLCSEGLEAFQKYRCQ